MSQENVELARKAFEAWNRGDVDAFFQTLDRNVEVYLPEVASTSVFVAVTKK